MTTTDFDVARALRGRDAMGLHDADFDAGLRHFISVALDPSTSSLDGVTRELVLLASHAAMLHTEALRGHVERALDAGALATQIHETFQLVATSRATSALYVPTALLDDALDGRQRGGPT